MATEFIDVTCPKCGLVFDVPASLRGGVSNCPDCHKLVEIKGTPDGFVYWILVALGILVTVGLTTGCYLAGGWVPALLCFLTGAAILTIVVVAS